MGSRARGYGLQRSLWVDDRQDPEKSTRAAAHHLKDLYAQFGDWYLAMAAYNSGPGTVQAAVRRTGYADFWELYRRNVLPKETRNYVPIILAMTIVSKNLSQYGFDDVSMDEPVAFDTVTINYPVDLRLVADCVDATPAQLQELNPSLLRLSTPSTGSFELHLPAGSKDQYETAIAAIPSDMRLWWRYHKVQPGDTLASLAPFVSRHRQVDCLHESARRNRTGSWRQVDHPGGGRQASAQRYGNLCPPDHALQGSQGRHGRDRRRELRRIRSDAPALEWPA
jgi:hypothetical protein